MIAIIISVIAICLGTLNLLTNLGIIGFNIKKEVKEVKIDKYEKFRDLETGLLKSTPRK